MNNCSQNYENYKYSDEGLGMGPMSEMSKNLLVPMRHAHHPNNSLLKALENH